MNKALFITSYFPPLGGPGVQRQLYYVLYANDLGWKTYILTVKDVIYHVYDPSLLDKLPPSVQIIRTESLEFGRILFHLQKIKPIFENPKKKKPTRDNRAVSSRMLTNGRRLRDWFTIVDDRMLWIPFALPAAIRAVNENNIDVIIARGGPYSNTILGLWVSKITHKPLVLDLADPWLDYPYINFPTFLHKKVNQYFEHIVFFNAEKISVASPIMKERIIKRYKDVEPSKIEIITNGYDAEEFTDNEIIIKPKQKFKITHVGTLSWIRYEAFRSLCLSLREAKLSNPLLAKKLEVVLIGDVSDESKAMVPGLGLEDIFRIKDYIPHSEAAKAMSTANLLFLPIDKTISNQDGCYVIPGKLFDYIGSKRPILMIGPKDSDAANMITSEEFGIVFEPDQISAISKFLLTVIQDKNFANAPSIKDNGPKYERKNLAKRFFEMIDSITALARPNLADAPLQEKGSG